MNPSEQHSHHSGYPTGAPPPQTSVALPPETIPHQVPQYYPQWNPNPVPEIPTSGASAPQNEVYQPHMTQHTYYGGHPQSYMAPSGMPPQGMPPQGMPPQGMPPQVMPLQGVHPPGMPPPGYSSLPTTTAPNATGGPPPPSNYYPPFAYHYPQPAPFGYPPYPQHPYPLIYPQPMPDPRVPYWPQQNVETSTSYSGYNPSTIATYPPSVQPKEVLESHPETDTGSELDTDIKVDSQVAEAGRQTPVKEDLETQNVVETEPIPQNNPAPSTEIVQTDNHVKDTSKLPGLTHNFQQAIRSFPLTDSRTEDTARSETSACNNVTYTINDDGNKDNLLDEFVTSLGDKLKALSPKDREEVVINALNKLGLAKCIDALVDTFGEETIREAAKG